MYLNLEDLCFPPLIVGVVGDVSVRSLRPAMIAEQEAAASWQQAPLSSSGGIADLVINKQFSHRFCGLERYRI